MCLRWQLRGRREYWLRARLRAAWGCMMLRGVGMWLLFGILVVVAMEEEEGEVEMEVEVGKASRDWDGVVEGGICSWRRGVVMA